MFGHLTPDYLFSKFDDITPEFLRGIGCTALVIDIDNTLAPYEQAEPDGRIAGWFEALKSAGIQAALISNNEKARVRDFNRTLGLPAYYKCRKPSTKYLRIAIEEMGADTAGTVLLGDQLLTDVFAAKRLGLRAIVVKPIKDKKTFFFRFKRGLEKPLMRRFHRRERKRREAEARERDGNS